MYVYTDMNDTNNNTTLTIVECDEGEMSVQQHEDSNRASETTRSENNGRACPDVKFTGEGLEASASKCPKESACAIRDFIDMHLKPQMHRSKRNGQTPIMLACLSGNISVVRQIAVCSSVSINKRDSEGNTALILAAQTGRDDIIQFLLWNYGEIEIDAENYFGLTALMKTALRGHSECARILIVAGADVEKRDDGRNYTAYDWARLCGFEKTAKMIKVVGSAGPLQIERRATRVDEKQSGMTRMARTIFCALKRRLAKMCSCRNEEWVDRVGSIYYLIEKTGPTGIFAWPLASLKLDRIHPNDSDISAIEFSSYMSKTNARTTEYEKLPKKLMSCSTKDIPVIVCTGSSPVAKRKSRYYENHDIDRTLLFVPTRRQKKNR